MKNEFQQRIIDVDEYKISCIIRNGAGPDIILIPGSFADFHAYDQVLDELEQDFKVLIMELPGHGDSYPIPEGGSIEQFSQLVVEIAKRLGLTSFCIGGHSIGGMVAIETGRIIPERVKGVISVEGWTYWRAAEAFAGDMVNTLSRKQLDSREKMRRRVMMQWDKHQIGDFCEIWTRWNGFDFLVNSKMPILEIWGDRGKKRPRQEQLYIPENDNIHMHWVDGASHSLLLERPKEIAKVINDFVSDVESVEK